MDSAEIRSRKRMIEEQYGPWLVHDIQLTPEIRTRQSEIQRRSMRENEKAFCHNQDPSIWIAQSPTATRIRRVVQVISDSAGKPLDHLRVLDLGAFEGGFGIELAARGSKVVAVEGRKQNIAKAEFAKDALSLHNLELVLDDVRNVTVEKYGQFDAVLCLGLLYHLNAPDVFEVTRNITNMCTGVLIIETEAHAFPDESFTWSGHTYWGGNRAEHDANATEDDKLENVLMSLNNNESFVLTRFSLINLMQNLGCSSVYECLVPPILGYVHRVTLAGLKKPDVGPLITAPIDGQYAGPYDEINSDRLDTELHFWYKKVRDYQLASQRGIGPLVSRLMSTLKRR